VEKSDPLPLLSPPLLHHPHSKTGYEWECSSMIAGKWNGKRQLFILFPGDNEEG
jgi:hypothetical protein